MLTLPYPTLPCLALPGLVVPSHDPSIRVAALPRRPAVKTHVLRLNDILTASQRVVCHTPFQPFQTCGVSPCALFHGFGPGPPDELCLLCVKHLSTPGTGPAPRLVRYYQSTAYRQKGIYLYYCLLQQMKFPGFIPTLHATLIDGPLKDQSTKGIARHILDGAETMVTPDQIVQGQHHDLEPSVSLLTYDNREHVSAITTNVVSISRRERSSQQTKTPETKKPYIEHPSLPFPCFANVPKVLLSPLPQRRMPVRRSQIILFKDQ